MPNNQHFYQQKESYKGDFTMKTIITRNIPHVIALPSKALGSNERFLLEYVYKVPIENFVLVDSMKEWIIVNKDLEHADEIIELVKEIMQSKYLPEKLFDEFLALTDKASDEILLKIYHDWRSAHTERELHYQALSLLKEAKSLRIHWIVKRNKEIIKELFEIGFGIYDKGAACDSQKGAENAFMYGYLLGSQNSKKESIS